MKPEITVSTSDLERLEGLLSKPPTGTAAIWTACAPNSTAPTSSTATRMPDNIIMMNSRARFREETSGRSTN